MEGNKIGRRYNGKLKKDLILLENSKIITNKEALLIYLSANHHLLLKEYNQAYEEYLQALHLGGPNWDYYLISNIKRIACLDQLDKHKEIITIVDNLLQGSLESPDLLYLFGKAYYKTGKYFKAIKKLKECLDLGELGYAAEYLEGCISYKTYYLLGKIYEKIKEYSLAFNYYEKALLTDPTPGEPALRIAKLLLKNNSREKAVEQLENYFNLDSPESLTILAYIFYATQCYDLALIYLERAIKISGRLDCLVYLQGCSLFFLNHSALSKAIFKKIPIQSDYYYAAQDFLCWCYWDEENYSEVKEQIDKLKKASSYQIICEIYLRLNLILSGEKHIPPLDILDKENQEKLGKHILWVLERMLALGKHFHFELSLKILELLPAHSLWGDLGKTCYYYGLEEKCIKYFLYYLKSKSYDKLAYEVLKQIFQDQTPTSNKSPLKVEPYLYYYSLAEMHYQAEEYEEALVYYKHSLTLNPNFFQPLYKMISILLNTKQELQAQNYLESYFELSDPSSLFLLSYLFYREKRYKIALAYLEEVKGSTLEKQQAAYYKAKCLYKMERYEESLKNLKLVQKESKHYFSSLDCTCYCLWAQGNLKKVEEILRILAQNSQNILQVEVYKSFNNYLLGKGFRKIVDSEQSSLEKRKWVYLLIEKILELKAFKEETIWNWLEKRDELLDKFRIAQIYYKQENYQKAWSYLIKFLEEEKCSPEVPTLLKKLVVLNLNDST